MKISYVLYSQNGLYNQFCSFQLLVALSDLFKDTQIDAINKKLHNKIQDPQKDLHNFVDTSNIDTLLRESNPDFLDLVDFEMPNVTFYPDDLHFKDRLNTNIIHTQSTYVNTFESDTDFNNYFFAKNPLFLKEDTHNVFTTSLAWYSTFFTKRPISMDIRLSKFNFKKEYLDLAKKISSELGSFNGAHTRVMNDHHQYYVLNEEKLNLGLETLKNSLPLYVSVDNFNTTLLNNISATPIHEVILNDFRSDFLSLSHANRVTLGLISSLVMAEADDFIGTPLSTFTGFIHQRRCVNGKPSFKFFPGVYDSYNENQKPYSWASLKTDQHCWQREFKECYLNV